MMICRLRRDLPETAMMDKMKLETDRNEKTKGCACEMHCAAGSHMRFWGPIVTLITVLAIPLFSAGCSKPQSAFPNVTAPGQNTGQPAAGSAMPRRNVTGVRQSGTGPAGAGQALRATGNEEYTGGDKEGAGVAEKQPDLIKEAGFDMIYPNFNKETGRQDPFVPVSLSQGPLDVMKNIMPEKFRVIGTAMTPSGQIAMIQVGDQTKIVREGDVLENGTAVKSISKYDVLLEKDSRQLRLTMFTRKRIAKLEEEQYPLLPVDSNINDLYKTYLEQKYGNEVAGKEGETQRPTSFNGFMESKPTTKNTGKTAGQNTGESSPGSDSVFKPREEAKTPSP
jgi:hypothetical protein